MTTTRLRARALPALMAWLTLAAADSALAKDQPATTAAPAKAAPTKQAPAKQAPAKREDRAKASGTDSGADQDEMSDGPVDIKVPESMRGRGYALRIGDDVIPLTGDKVTTQRSDRRLSIELLDDTGRHLDSDKAYVDEHIFDHLDARTWRIGFLSGGTTTTGKALENLLQDGRFSETSLEVAYQLEASPVGLALSFASLTSNDTHSYGIESNYDISQTRLAATLELAPFAQKTGFLRRLHLIGYAGAHSSRHHVEIRDGIVKIEDTANAVGPYGALELAYPFSSFWLSVRGYYTYQTIKLKAFDFNSKTVQQGLLAGGSYAF